MQYANDMEIRDAFYERLSETEDDYDGLDTESLMYQAWDEAFRRGMRFKPNASQPSVEADAKSRCGLCGGTGIQRESLDVEEYYKD